MRAIEAVDDAVVEHLRDIGFDEARYGARVGFGKLKWCVSTFFAHASSCRCMQCLSSTLGILALIRELSYAPGIWRRNCREEYRDAAPSTLTVLQQRCELVAAELASAEQNLANANDVPALRKAGQRTRLL